MPVGAKAVEAVESMTGGSSDGDRVDASRIAREERSLVSIAEGCSSRFNLQQSF